MDEGEDEVDVEREDSGGGGAGSSSGRLAVREVGVDVEAAVERATRAASAAQREQIGGGPVGVKKKGKKHRAGRSNSKRREAKRGERAAEAAATEERDCATPSNIA